MVSGRCRRRQNEGGRRQVVGEGLEICRSKEGGRGHGVGGGSGGGVFRARPHHWHGQEVVTGRGGGRGFAWLGPQGY